MHSAHVDERGCRCCRVIPWTGSIEHHPGTEELGEHQKHRGWWINRFSLGEHIHKDLHGVAEETSTMMNAFRFRVSSFEDRQAQQWETCVLKVGLVRLGTKFSRDKVSHGFMCLLEKGARTNSFCEAIRQSIVELLILGITAHRKRSLFEECLAKGEILIHRLVHGCIRYKIGLGMELRLTKRTRWSLWVASKPLIERILGEGVPTLGHNRILKYIKTDWVLKDRRKTIDEARQRRCRRHS
mmetsp:Transcript_2673/g.6436  ORF Transcript_2673/g.6436 Transcript_2673/m.6436 type:complete len:241 (+) Transcript_2673:1800-2522(+)